MKARIAVISLIVLMTGWLLSHFGYCQQEASLERRLIFFYSPTCKKCQELKNNFLPRLEKDFKGRFKIEQRDITRMEDYALLLRLEEKYSPKLDNSVPLFFFEGHFLSSKDLYRQLNRLLAIPQFGRAEEKVGLEGIVYRFRALEPMTIISAGLIDGINPCAFTVIIFFMSFLALQGYRRRELLAIGLAFIFAVFLTYILIGVGLFGFLYRLRGFWVVSRVINITVGLFSVVLGALALYDFFKFRKTRQTEGLVLQLPQYLKNRIHSIIGAHYRAVPSADSARKGTFALILSALVSGFLVSIIEAVCTGQVYLPTIVFVLKATHLKAQALIYLLLYNLLFILPLLVIFFFALIGVTSEQFSRFFKKHLGLVKVLMAILFFILGFSLLYSYFPNAMRLSKAAVTSSTVAVTADKEAYTETWNFGKIKEGAVVKHAFLLKNTSCSALEITGVRTSCGCATSKLLKTRLAPGESTSLEVEFNSKGYSGATRQYLYVNTDNLDRPLIKFIIEADVIK